MIQLKYFKRKIFLLSLISFVIAGQGCSLTKTGQSEYCTIEDFTKLDKIDIHCHIFSEYPAFMEQAVSDKFSILSINVDADEGPTLERQREMSIFQMKAYPESFSYLMAFSMENFEKENWQGNTISDIEESLKKGAIGVKVWKNIGMIEKNKDGKFIMIDDPKFDPIFNYLEKNNIPIVGHLGEPKNCWLPLNEMTVNSDKAYYEANPQYHMYLHPEHKSYEEQITARDHMLEKHPNLKFIGAHLASLEWNIEELTKRLERFPNLNIDMAERICHLQVQSQTDWQNVHDFFMKYQDRIIYGTDMGDFDGTGKDLEALKKKMHKTWIRDWKFFTTDEVLTVEEVDGDFKGMKLPKEVIEKLYYNNAKKIFPGM